MALACRRILAMLTAASTRAAGNVGGTLNSLQGLDIGLHHLFTESQARPADHASGIQEIVAETCAFWNVTGCSVGVSFNGSEILANFGVMDKTSGAAVGPDSLFQIGSTTKAYTAMAILQRVAQGELDLDVPVTQYLPEFNLSADGADGLTLRDLLSHRTGMPRHDTLCFAFLQDDRTTEARMDLVRRLPGLALDKPIRYGWEYNNLMVVTAGLIAGFGHKDGWEGLVNDQVLKPLNMTDTWLHAKDLDAAARDRFATPYKQDGTVHELLHTELIGPAGSIVSSTREQLKWLTAHMEQLASETPLVDSASFGQLLRPNANAALLNPFGTYTLTWWFEQLTSDIFLLHHGGNTNGFSAHNIVVLQAKSQLFNEGKGSPMQPLAAISILTNQDQSSAPLMLLLQITSLLAKLPLIPNLNQLQYDAGAPARAQQAAALRQFEQMLEDGKSQPSRFSASEAAGTYEDVAYGQLVVQQSAQGSLTIALPNSPDPRPTPLVHFWNDTFGVEFQGTKVPFQFVGDAGGPVTALTAVLEPAVPAIIFDRVGDVII